MRWLPRTAHGGEVRQEWTGLARDRFAQASALVLRLAMALMWYQNLSWKVPPEFGASDNSGLAGYVADAFQHPVFGPYASLAQNVLLPNIRIFGWVVLLTEGALALFLLLGLFTRLFALIGVVQALAIYLSVANTPGEWVWSYYLMMGASLVVAGVAAGRVVGVDRLLRPRLLRSDGILRRLAILT